MKIKFPYGSTAQNNQLLLPQGMLTVDLDKKALRIHDGVTLGGFEILGTQAYVPPPPGPTTLVAGNTTAGLYGVVANTSLITPTDLRTEVGAAAVNFQNLIAGANSVPWIKFAYEGKILFVAQGLLIAGITWNGLNTAGAAFGTKTITIAGHTYKVRLMRGANADPATSLGREWTGLMNKVTVGPWASYGQGVIDGQSGASGYRTLLQETAQSDSTRCIYAWQFSPTAFDSQAKGGGSSAFGWRPVLECTSAVAT